MVTGTYIINILLTATKLRDWLNTSQSHRKHSIENKEHGREPSLDILANYANLNVSSNRGHCHVIN